MATAMRRVRNRVARMPLVARARGARRSHSKPVSAASPGGDARRVAMFEGLQWQSDDVLEIRGWAFVKGVPSSQEMPVILDVLDSASGRVERIVATTWADPEVNASAGDDVDHAWAAFSARFDVAGYRTPDLARTGVQASLTITVEVATAEGVFRGRFTHRNDGGSAGVLSARALADGQHVTPTWSAARGLGLRFCVEPAVAMAMTRSGSGAQLELQVRGDFNPVRGILIGSGSDRVGVHLGRGAQGRFTLQVGRPSASAVRSRQVWTLHLEDSAGRAEPVRWGAGSTCERLDIGHGGALECQPDAALVVVREPLAVILTSVEPLSHPVPGVSLHGRLTDPSGTLGKVLLTALRTEVSAQAWSVGEGGEFRAFVPLAAPASGGMLRALPAAKYVVSVSTAAGAPVEVRVEPTCAGQFDRREYGPLYNLRLSRRAGRLELDISAPLAPDEIGTFHQKRLRVEFARPSPAALEGTFLESWFGRSVSDNPLALYRELERRGLGAPYSWGVADLSIEVPEGARAVVVRSREWWRASTRAQYVVINCWQRSDFLKREGQVVLQTWHGTPYKLLGLDRPTKSGRPGSIRKIERDTGAWDVLLSQNEHTSRAFRSAYLWERPILEVGYPRNDVLARDDRGQRAQIRTALGLAEHEVAVLYAPTWREDDRSKVGVLDLDRVARSLGPQFRLLVRGHSTSLRSAPSIRSREVIDVTTYPDVADLMVASDVLVTDYSSIMFDYSVSGRPILFYVPDLDEYAGVPRRSRGVRRLNLLDPAKARGVYFDLAAVAPGPLLTREKDLVSAILTREDVARRHAARYMQWKAAYNPHDDGHASERVVDALFLEHQQG